MCQYREEGAYALENASESREVEPISSDLRSEATEEEGIGSTSRDEDAFLVCKHPPHGINIVIRKNSPYILDLLLEYYWVIASINASKLLCYDNLAALIDAVKLLIVVHSSL